MRNNMTIEVKRVQGDLQMPDSSILMYTTEDGLTKIEVTFEDDTVWLSIDQMAELFQRDKSTISRHIKNIFNEGELDKKAVVANFATTASVGKSYHVSYYNLDVIISVGYRNPCVARNLEFGQQEFSKNT